MKHGPESVSRRVSEVFTIPYDIGNTYQAVPRPEMERYIDYALNIKWSLLANYRLRIMLGRYRNEIFTY